MCVREIDPKEKLRELWHLSLDESPEPYGYIFFKTYIYGAIDQSKQKAYMKFNML